MSGAPTTDTPAGPSEFLVSFVNPLPYELGPARLGVSATRGVTVEVLLGGGQQVAAGATAEFRLAVSRSAKLAGKRAVVSLELDTDVLTDIPGEIEIAFA